MDGEVMIDNMPMRFIRSTLGKFAILMILIMVLIPLYIKGIVMILILEFVTFGIFEFFLRKSHLLEKKVVVPLPNFLESNLGDVYVLCRKNVGRGNLKELEGKWICLKCYGEEQKRKGGDLDGS